MSSSQIEQVGRGLRRANEIAFQIHARAWLFVNLLLVVIWALAGFGSFWPAWSAVCWGFALGIHGTLTYARFGGR